MTPEWRDTQDARLRRLLRQGDVGGVVAQLEPMARRVADDYYLVGAERIDLHQEARIGVAKAVRDFSAGVGVPFVAFAELCARRQVITAVKTATRRKHSPLNLSTSLDRPTGEGEDSPTLAEVIPLHAPAPDEQLEQRAEVDRVIAVVQRHLSETERIAVVAVLLGGASYDEVAGETGLTVKTIDNALQRARRKLAYWSERPAA